MKNKVRFLMKDVLPFETPIIHSNKQFINAIVQNGNTISKEVDCLLSKDSPFSVPYNFKIQKNDNTSREMSLIHPLAQLQWLAFICKYDRGIIALCRSRNLFSIRCPHSITPYYMNKNYKGIIIEKLNTEFIGYGINNEIKAEDLINQTYFAISGYVNLQKYYDSYRFRNLEMKFNSLAKLDISKFFNSIYTHSISWSLSNSKIIAKNELDKNDNLASDFDRIMQRSNYNETHGIVVGSELSRIFAEIILLDVERKLYSFLSENELKRGIDYDIYRYVDDIHVFFNELNTWEKIMHGYENFLSEYKLYLNNSKTVIYKRPFTLNRKWVVDIQECLKIEEKDVIVLLESLNIRLYSTQIHEKKWIIKQLIVDNSDVTSISPYTLAVLLSNILTYVKKYIKMCEMKNGKLEKPEDKEESEKISNLLERNLVFLITTNLELVFYILSIQPMYKNCLKVVKSLTKLLLILRNKNISINIVNSVKGKVHYEISQILKYNLINSELLNLLIIAKFMDTKINSDIIYNLILKNKYDYFTYITVIYYIYDFDLKKLKDESYKLILDYIEDQMRNLESFLITQQVKNIFMSNYFYLINDLSLCPALNENLKIDLRNLLFKEHLNNKSVKLLTLMLKHNISFTNWFMELDEIVIETTIVDYRAKRQYD